MKVGKVSESVLKRSILKPIKTKNENVINGAGVGEDCAIFASSDTVEMAVCVQESAVKAPEDMVCLVHRAANNLACAGAFPTAVMLALCVPESMEESEVRGWMETAEAACHTIGIQIAGGHTAVAGDVTYLHVTVTGIGKRNRDSRLHTENIRPGQDIVISKWIGLEGTARLAALGREQLSERYPLHMIEEAQSFNQYISVIPEAAAAVKSNVSAMHDVSEGGIFRALWEVAESTGVGLEIDLKKLPIRQETIEICEFYNINPYELLSGGSLIMITDKGTDLVWELERQGIHAAAVGRITDNNDRVIINEEERRFLDRPRTDEIYKV